MKATPCFRWTFIRFEGQAIVGKRPDQICRLGVARTFQIVKPFPSLTVLENLRTGAMFGRAQMHRVADADAACRQVLEEVGLAAAAERSASSLTLSGQKRLEIARCVATGARLLVIEHVMRALMELCGHIVVLHHGELIAEGTPSEIGENEKVLSVYFGAHA